MSEPLLPVTPNLFAKVLAVVMTLVLVGWLGALWIYGELTRVDMVGSLISAFIFSYLVHLWIARAREDRGSDN